MPTEWCYTRVAAPSLTFLNLSPEPALCVSKGGQRPTRIRQYLFVVTLRVVVVVPLMLITSLGWQSKPARDTMRQNYESAGTYWKTRHSLPGVLSQCFRSLNVRCVLLVAAGLSSASLKGGWLVQKRCICIYGLAT